MSKGRFLASIACTAFCAVGAPAARAPGARVARVDAASAHQEAAPCTAVADKWASPGLVLVGEEVSVTLHLDVACAGQPVPLDIVLVLDRSTSMYGPPIAAVRDAARAFVDQMDLERHRIGVVSFADLSRVDAQLARRRAYLVGAIDGLRAKGGTDIAAGIRAASAMLANSNNGAAPVIVLLTDGYDNNGDRAVRQAAAFARDSGATLVTIAVEYGAAVALLREIASAPDLAFVAPASRDIAAIYQRVSEELQAVHARDAVLRDDLPIDMALVAGSVEPAATVAGRSLSWSMPLVPAGGITLTYRVRPSMIGLRPTNVMADASYTIPDGSRVGTAFPIPVVEVVAELPSPTPTPMRIVTATPEPPTSTPEAPTPTGSPTSSAVRRYLPSLLSAGCPLSGRPADVVLVVDVSTTMRDPTAGGRPKIDAVREGALTLAKALTGRGKRMGIVSFDREARQLSAVTGDVSRLEAALYSIQIASGSRIDLGLDRAAAALAEAAASRPPGARRIVVLATDGRPVGTSGEQIGAAATALREAGVALHVLAVGADADLELLAGLVALPGALWSVGDGEGFAEAAGGILAQLDCR